MFPAQDGPKLGREYGGLPKDEDEDQEDQEGVGGKREHPGERSPGQGEELPRVHHVRREVGGKTAGARELGPFQGLDPVIPDAGQSVGIPGNPILEVVDGLAGQEDNEAEEGHIRKDRKKDGQPSRHPVLLKPNDNGKGQDGQEQSQGEGEENRCREPEAAHHDDHQRQDEEEPGSGILLHPLRDHGSPSYVRPTCRCQTNLPIWPTLGQWVCLGFTKITDPPEPLP